MGVPEVLIFGSDPTDEQLSVVKKVTEDLKASEEFLKHEKEAEAYVDQHLVHRFLCARDYQVDKALPLLKNHIKWRFDDYRPYEIKASEVEEYAKRGAVQVSPHGNDVYGRPILMLDDSKDNVQIKNAKEKQREAMRHLVFNIERAISLFPDKVRKYAVFINLQDFSLFSAPSMSTTKETLHILSVQYPERLGLAVLYKAPWVFKKFFDGVSMFIDKVTRQKIVFITGDTSDGSSNDKKLRELLGPEWKKLVNADLPKPSPKVANGYNHEEYWKMVEMHESSQLKLKDN